jgi:hypothetical protein
MLLAYLTLLFTVKNFLVIFATHFTGETKLAGIDVRLHVPGYLETTKGERVRCPAHPFPKRR